MKIQKIVGCLLGLTLLTAHAQELNLTQAQTNQNNQAQKLSSQLKVAYESKYVFRGVLASDEAIQPSLSLNYAAHEAISVYASAWNSSPLQSSQANEIDLVGGVKYTHAALTWDLGYTSYMYPNNEEANPTNEILFGVSYDMSELLGDVALVPSCYYFYDIDLEQQCIEGRLSYSMPMSEWMSLGDSFSIDMAASCGYIDQLYRFNYLYVSIVCDLVLACAENASLSLGPRYSYHNEGYSTEKSRTNFWFGMSLKVDF